MKVKEVPPVKVYFPDEDIVEVQKDVEKILRSGMLTLGEYTKRFESAFAEFCNTKYAVAMSSGTGALEVALRSLDLKGGDEVLVPTNTFSASAASVMLAGGKPVFTDIDAKSLCIDAQNIEKYLTKKTKAVMAVHIGGLVCPDIKHIKQLCEDHKIALIEDAAHAQGSSVDKQKAGSFGIAGCFSFYPTKVITTGEGGMITTNNDEMAKKAIVLRDQGKENFNSNIIIQIGSNWRMTEISAAMGLTQLKRLPDFITHRNKIARYYDAELAKIDGVKTIKTPPQSISNYYKYTILVSNDIPRDTFKQKLREHGVRSSGEVYWPPLHLEPVYQKILGVREGDFPVAEDVCRRMVCLPIYNQMTMEEAEFVIDKVREVLSKS
jgi:dTDP-4-amino-4,6-dideoxygalactose transaminase